MSPETKTDLVRANEEYRLVAPEQQIAVWREQFMALAVTDVESRAQLAVVHEARMTVKSARVEVEKTRKRLKEDALRWGKVVDGEAKRITALMEPIEEHLAAEERKVEEHKAAQAAEALRVRLDALEATNPTMIDVRAVEKMSDANFEDLLRECQAAAEARAAKAAEEAELKAAEQAAIEAEKARLAAVWAEQEAANRAEQQRVAQEREAVAARERAVKEREDAQRAEAEAAAMAEANRARDEEAKAKREAQAEYQKRQAREQAKLEADRAPDREKVAAFLAELEAVTVPEVWCRSDIDEILVLAFDDIGQLIGREPRGEET
jgi:hypothetical protein